ncbi:MAG: ATP synthase F1 subunit delta [Candidatus Omnitrophota bacterium]
MKDLVVSKIYAQGFLGLIKDTIGYDRGLEEMFRVRQVLTTSSDLLEFLENPEIIRHQKENIIDRIFAVGFSRETLHFLKLLLEKKRFDSIIDIADQVRFIYYSAKRLNVLVKTVIPLDVDVLEILKQKLEKRFGKPVALFIGIDPELIGGVQLVIGNTVIDGSLKRRIQELKEKLMTVRVN